ncbi:RNA-binding protein 15-like [Diadema setosum]|uniref:RNA-binding protein 15-like n=1 Tax=Diadema setosum TaxID=31175 RepID=UPI003B3A8C6B
MDRQQGRKPMRRMRESPDMPRVQERDRMSPGSDRYDGRGGGKMGGRVRSMEREDRRGDVRDRRPQRDDRDHEPYTNYDRGQSFHNDGYKREPDCLRISNFPSHVSDTAIRDALFHEFKKYGEVNVRVVFNNAKNERIAYVKFRLPEQAHDAKQARGDRLTLFARPLHIVAIVNRNNRDQGSDGGFMSRNNDFQGRRQYGGMQGRNFRQDMGSGGGGRGRDRDYQYDNRRNYGNDNYHQGQGRDRERDAMFLPEDDPKATRTVFCGNLEEGITESEIRHHFERYGFVEDVDIKYPPRGQGNPFAFVKFENLDMAYKAIISMSGQYIGRNQCKTGYGKQSPTNCLWVGGLGPWITLGVLEREFDRFGAIRKIDYTKGDSFAYIQYETVEAAQAAAGQMRGIPLGGPDKRLRVDFAEAPGFQTQKKPFRYQPSPSRHDDSISSRGYSRYNQDRDFGPDLSPPPYRDGPDQWQGGGGGYEGQNRGNWQSGNRYSRNDTWIRKENDQSGRMMQRMDNRRKRPGSPDDYIRDDWSPPNNKAPRRRKSPGIESRDWSPDHRKHRGDVSPRGRDWETSPVERVRRQRSLSSDLSDPDFDGPPVERRHKRGKRSKIPDGISRLPDLVKYLNMLWRGHLVLKNSAFATRMFLVGGDANTAANLLPHDVGSDESALKITQRLRLDHPKLEEVGKRISQAGSGDHAVLLAMPGTSDDSETLPSGAQSRALLNLVTYLQQKQAAGVISLPVSAAQNKDNVGVLHAFPPCEFSHKYLLDIAPGLGPEPSKDDHLVVIIVKGVA